MDLIKDSIWSRFFPGIELAHAVSALVQRPHFQFRRPREFLKYTFSPGVGMFEAGVLDNLICANRYQHCWGEGGAPG